MLRKFNYTGRTRIEKSEALFSISAESQFKNFDVVFNLDIESFPESAALYIEAYYKETRQRFSFGLVTEQKPPSSRLLDEIDLSGDTLFRVIVVDESDVHGKILASGDGFRAGAENKGNSESLIAVGLGDLGSEIWRVEIEADGTPELCLNKKIPNAINRLTEDRLFQSLILPAAFRQILMYFMWNGEDDESDAKELWMEFAEKYGGKKPFLEDTSDTLRWIDEVVSAFSSKFKFCEQALSILEDE